MTLLPALAAGLIAAVLTACAPARQAPPAAPASAAGAEEAQAYYRRIEAAGQRVLRIDARDSLIAVTVRRGGPFARFGHDHIVASRTLEGAVAPGAGRTDFRFRLDQLSVDEAALRTGAGFDSQPSAADIDGTRRNMLDKVLDAGRFPLVLVHAEGSGQLLRAAITLHGVTRTLALPARIERAADGAMAVSGALTLRQSDFGIVPFAVLGGALAVQDSLELRYRIVAR